MQREKREANRNVITGILGGLFLAASFWAKGGGGGEVISDSNEPIVIRIHCWEGYAEPYVEGFKTKMREKHGVEVHLVITNVSDPGEFFEKARKKEVDLISPAHNIPKSRRWPFIDGNIALPLRLENIPHYVHVLSVLQKNPFVTKGEKVYGAPYTMGPYGLAYNTEKVAEEPTSWAVLWEEKNRGHYSVSLDYADCNIYTAALVLGASYEEIYDYGKLTARISPRELQAKLNDLARYAASLWVGTENAEEFGDLWYAAAWGVGVSRANAKGLQWKMAKPKEGTTFWVDHWVITYAVEDEMKRLLCEEWIDYCLSPEIQVAMLRNWGTSPVVVNVKDRLTDEEIQTFNVGNNEYWKTLSLWQHQDVRTQNSYKLMWETAVGERK